MSKTLATAKATGVAVYDLLPREFVYDSSLPSGSVGLSKIFWSVGTLNPGQSFTIELTVKVRNDITINPGTTVTNTAFASSLEDLFVQDSAVLMIRAGGKEPIICAKPDVSLAIEGVKPVQKPDGLFWELESGKAYNLKVKVFDNGGCSPYTVNVDWGDGTTEMFNLREGDSVMTKELTHTFANGGSSSAITINLKNRFDGQYESIFKYNVK